MPSSRVPTTPQNAHVSSNTNTPDFHMSHTPPGSPASPHSSIQTPTRDPADKVKFRSVPAHLQFFLEPNVNLDLRSTTKKFLEQIIKHFVPHIHASENMSKPALKCLFYEYVLPIIRECTRNTRNTTPFSTPSRINGSNTPLEYQYYAHAFNPLFDPKHRNSTKKILQAAIQHKSPSIKLRPLNLMKKPDLIALFERHVHQAPAPRAPFAGTPRVLAVSELQGQTKDELRFALQANVPHLFIMSHVAKPGLINLYRRFMLGEPDAQGGGVQAQRDFFMINEVIG